MHQQRNKNIKFQMIVLNLPKINTTIENLNKKTPKKHILQQV